MRTHVQAAAILVIVLFMPLALFAQDNASGTTELEAVIRAELAADPNSAALSPEDFDALVEALVGEAAEEGITAEDITWTPQESSQENDQVASTTCERTPGFLCALNEALGFSGGNILSPLLLLFGSFVLLFLLRALRKAHHPSDTSPPPSSSGQGFSPPPLQ